MNAAPGTCRKALFARWHHPQYRQYGVGGGASPMEDLWSGWGAVSSSATSSAGGAAVQATLARGVSTAKL